MVTGLVGSEELLEFTVMGDAVNVAARIESLTRRLEADILVSGAVRERLGGRYSLREMPPSLLRGKAEPFPTWAVPA